MLTVQSPPSNAVAAEKIIQDHVALAMVAGLVPVPLVEFVAVSAVHVTLVEELAKTYGVEFYRHQASAIVGSLLAATASTSAAFIAARSVSKVVPGVGPVVGWVVAPSLAGAITFALGQVLVGHFAAGGTLQTLDLATARLAFRRALEEKKPSFKTVTKSVGARIAEWSDALGDEFDAAIANLRR